MGFAIPDDERLFIDRSMEDRIVLTGIRVELGPDKAIAGRKLIVRATEIEIHGHINLPGGVIDLFAQRITAAAGSIIDVSGAIGAPDFTGRAPALSGAGPGDAGQAGENGGDGGHAGQIDIVCESIDGELRLVAMGGNGGAAQSGGNGIAGGKGGDMHGCSPPTAGGPGGDAGTAGRPGKGGNGGTVSVSVYMPLADPSQVQISVSAGTPGAPGRHGAPGAKGFGGNGGTYGEWYAEPCVV
tara:strand:+ start:6043 stop:6765 length:723 start_codon:yes stop_codon:yes gene_type:complete